MSLYEYVESMPIGDADSYGMLERAGFFKWLYETIKEALKPDPYKNTPFKSPPGGGITCPSGLEGCVDVRENPDFEPPTNGCTKVPDKYKNADFEPCCNDHDICYGTCGANKRNCDDDFVNCMLDACDTAYPPGKDLDENKKCKERATLYWEAVGDLGCKAFRRGQEGACICCDQPNPDPLCECVEK